MAKSYYIQAAIRGRFAGFFGYSRVARLLDSPRARWRWLLSESFVGRLSHWPSVCGLAPSFRCCQGIAMYADNAAACCGGQEGSGGWTCAAGLGRGQASGEPNGRRYRALVGDGCGLRLGWRTTNGRALPAGKVSRGACAPCSALR